MQKSILIAGLLALSATAASAHATLEQREAAAGKTTKITLRIPHGCKGEATHTVNLMIPDGFYNAKPMPKAGWELKTETGTYSTPYNNHGREMTEGVRKVIWSGGNLENGWYDEFTIRGTVGPDVAPGTVMYFPALQECANGVADWTDTSGAKDAKHPAPKLTVIAGEGGHHDHAMATPESFTLGDLTIEGPFSRATLPNQPVGGGFFKVTNNGSEDDMLIGASSAVAGHMEVHEMAMEGDVMKMRQLTEGLPIPAGKTVELKPGGYHIMFMELKRGLVEGEVVEVEVEFAKAGKITLPLTVRARSGGGHNHGHSHDHGKASE